MSMLGKRLRVSVSTTWSSGEEMKRRAATSLTKSWPKLSSFRTRKVKMRTRTRMTMMTRINLLTPLQWKRSRQISRLRRSDPRCLPQPRNHLPQLSI